MDLPHLSSSGLLWPVSIKGVVRTDDRVLLAYNDREEWELLGGRLELGEEPSQTVIREVFEESGLVVVAGELIDVWVQPVNPDASKNVLIAAYDCPVLSAQQPTVSDEHSDVRWWSLDVLQTLPLPAGYQRAVESAVRGNR